MLYLWTSKRIKAKSSLSVSWNKNWRTPHVGDEILGESKYLLLFFSPLPGHPVFQHCQRVRAGAGGGRGWCWQEVAGTAPHSQVARLSLQLLVLPHASSTCLAAAPKEKCCLMSCICPSRHENSARKAAHSEMSLLTARHGSRPFSKGSISCWPGIWYLSCNKFSQGYLSFFLQVLDLCWVVTIL